MPEWFREAIANFGKTPALEGREGDSKA